MLPVRALKPGTRLRIEKKSFVTGEHSNVGEKKRESEEVTVIRQYPHHVLAQNRYGVRRCIPNAEVYGILMRNDKVERALHDGKGRIICEEE